MLNFLLPHLQGVHRCLYLATIEDVRQVDIYCRFNYVFS